MNKKIVFFLTMILVLTLVTTTALAAKKSENQTGAQMVTIVVFIVVIVGGFLALICRKPASVKEAERRQKERSKNIQNAITEASTNRLGIVILRFALGHYKTTYIDGQRNTYLVAGSDSANGWTCEITIINSCGKTIKYITFNIRALNAVGDLCSCSIGKPINNLNADGPISHGSTGSWHWDTFVYSANLSTLNMDSVTVEYMDGTKEEFSEDELVWRN